MSTGRPRSELWNDNYSRGKDPKTNKLIAICNICNKIVKNTSKERLKLHRFKCPKQFSDSDESRKRADQRLKRCISQSDCPPSLSEIEDVQPTNSVNRLLHTLWDDSFIRVKNPKTNATSAKCNICKKILVNTAMRRLQIHRGRCHRDQKNQVQYYSDSDETQSASIKPKLTNSVWVPSFTRRESVITNPTSNLYQLYDAHPNSSSQSEDNLQYSQTRMLKIDAQRKPLTNDEKLNIDHLFGMYVYSCDDPMKTAESLHLRKFIKAVRPEYEIPTVEELKTTIKEQCRAQFRLTIPVVSNLFDEDQEIKDLLSTVERKLEKTETRRPP